MRQTTKKVLRGIGLIGPIGLILLAQEVFGLSVEFDIQPRAVRVGEPAICSFTIRGMENPPAPALPPLQGFQASSVGTERSFSFGTGGKDSAVTYRYQLLPLQPGRFRIGPFQYTAGGETAQVPAVDIEVVPPEGRAEGGDAQPQWSELLFAVLRADRTNVYHQEIFDIYLSIYSRGLNLARDIALMNLPASGLAVQPFQEVGSTREVVNNQIYDVRRFRAKAQALTAGDFKLSPNVRVGIVVPRERRRSRDPFGGMFDDSFFDSFFNRAQTQPVDIAPKPVEITVAPLPAPNRPEGFGGAVGRFAFDAQVKPTEVSAGDPVTLSLQLAGVGNLENAQPPRVADGPAFKTYEAKLVSKQISEAEGAGRKLFEQVLIPRSENVTEVPALAFSYFDPTEGAYKTLTRGPFPLVVHPASNAAARLVQAPADETGARTMLLGTDIVYLKPAPTRWRRTAEPRFYATKGFLALQLVPILAMATVLVSVRRRETLARDVARARRQRAPRSARAGIRLAEQALKAGDRRAFYDALAQALAAYFGDRLNLSPGEVTPDIVLRALERGGLEASKLDALHELFGKCEEARFAGAAAFKVGADEADRLASELNELHWILKACERTRL